MVQKISKSQRLHEELGRIIAKTKPGQRLLTEPELAKQLGVSRATLREAMRTFETQGLITRRQGSGTYVIHPTQIIESGLELLESIQTMAKKTKLVISMGEVDVTRRDATLVESKAFNLPLPLRVYEVARIILAEGRPVAFLIDIIPDDLMDFDDLQKEFSGSMLDLLTHLGTHNLAYSRAEITATISTPKIARAMGIQSGDVLLHFYSYLYTTKGRMINLAVSYFLPGYFRFHVIRRVNR